MDVNRLIQLIDAALAEADDFEKKYYVNKEWLMDGTRKSLLLLKSEVLLHPEKINNRVLRAMNDTGMASFKQFENSPLESAINKVTGFLYNEIPEYRHLKPLYGDFDKGDPI
jgi:hypothetical protein